MLSVQTLDRKIWRRDQILNYLFKCHEQNVDILLDYGPEGSCSNALGMYRLLDYFCNETGYKKNRITIKTANMLETHPEYRIQRMAEYWYEVYNHKLWLSKNQITVTNDISKHFANFTSRSNWARLWLATIINTKFSETALQTYHYDQRRENYNYNGYVGLDDLFKFGCNIVPAAAEFLTTCPKTIDLEFLKTFNVSESIFQHKNSYYPIQYPANLNLLQFYSNIFVDVYAEPNVSGNCFLVTEKTWRPIIARRPFIILSNPGFLSNLQKLGFKTFNAFWDEGYDDYGEGDRILKIETLLESIAAWPIEKCQQLLVEMGPILEHNYRVFTTLTTKKIAEVFDGIVD